MSTYYTSNGETSTGWTLNNDSMFVLPGGVVNSTEVNPRGVLYLSGGTANVTTVNSEGHMTLVSSGARANSTTINSGGSMRISGGSANSITVNSGGSLLVLGSGKATLIRENGGFVETGGSATVTFVPTTLSGLTLIRNSATLHSGTTALSASVSSGGSLHIRGGLANSAAIFSSGAMVVSSGGTANNTKISAGVVTIPSGGGLAQDTSVSSGGIMHISGGGTAYGTTVYSGGIVNVSAGGTMKHASVSSGSVYVSSGGTLGGRLILYNNALVSFASGGILDFDICRVDPGEPVPLVSTLALIDGTPHFTLTVDGGDQDAGTYRLAGSAAGFDSTITVKNYDGSTLGSLTVGQSAKIDGVNYTLNLEEGTLSVTVGGKAPGPGSVPPFLTGDFNGDGADMLARQKDGTVTIFMNGEQWGLGVTLEAGWDAVATGDFNGDKMDDILRVNTEGYVVGEMSNGNGTFTPQVLNMKSAGWSILGTGDFNGNGSDDVLIANPTGASETVGLLGYWESGVTWTLINGYSPEWEMVSTGDFNADGKCDMLWRNSFEGDGGLTYNAYCTWIVDPPAGQSDWRMVSVANPKEWKFLCSGDFDGNGMNDIAMINGEGVVGIWGVNDGYLNSWSILSAVDASAWELAGVGDFNGDKTDDIAWRQTSTGLTGYWQISNLELAGWQNIATIA